MADLFVLDIHFLKVIAVIDRNFSCCFFFHFHHHSSQIFIFHQFRPYFLTGWLAYFSNMIWWSIFPEMYPVSGFLESSDLYNVDPVSTEIRWYISQLWYADFLIRFLFRIYLDSSIFINILNHILSICWWFKSDNLSFFLIFSSYFNIFYHIIFVKFESSLLCSRSRTKSFKSCS